MTSHILNCREPRSTSTRNQLLCNCTHLAHKSTIMVLYMCITKTVSFVKTLNRSHKWVTVKSILINFTLRIHSPPQTIGTVVTETPAQTILINTRQHFHRCRVSNVPLNKIICKFLAKQQSRTIKMPKPTIYFNLYYL